MSRVGTDGQVYDLALVIPAYNEEERLPSTLARLTSFAQAEEIRLQIVVSNDGSSDQTAEVVMSHPPSSSAVEIQLVSSEHRGKGAAVRRGMDFAKAPVVGYCDADLSAGPDAISRVRMAIEKGSEVAMASRGLPGSDLLVRQAWPREIAGKAFNRLLRLTTGLPFRDTQCGLKLFTSDAAREVFRYQRLDGFAFDTEVAVLASRLGFQVEEVPIRWAHVHGSKVSMARDGARMARDLWWIVRRLGKAPLVSPGIPAPEAGARMVEVEQAHWWHQAKRRLVSRLTEAAPGGPLLDVGCGGAVAIAELGKDRMAVGVDLSRDLLMMARARSSLSLVQGEASVLPFRDSSCALVLALDSLEHHPNALAMLREIRRVLAPAGLLVVTVPAYGWMWSYADVLLGHYRRYTRNELVKALNQAGFIVERSTYFHSWLLPVAWLFRRLKGAFGRGHSTDDFPLNPFLNRLLLGITQAELRILDRTNMPFGLSVVAAAHPRSVHASFSK